MFYKSFTKKKNEKKVEKNFLRIILLRKIVKCKTDRQTSEIYEYIFLKKKNMRKTLFACFLFVWTFKIVLNVALLNRTYPETQGMT